MYSSKLIQVLRAFNKTEFKNLYKFLNKPAFKDSARRYDAILFKAIYPYHPFLEKSKIEKGRIFKKVYAGEIYKPGKLEKQMTSLFSLVQEFIIIQNQGNRDDLHQLLVLTDFYRSRALHGLADLSAKKYQKVLNKTRKNDVNYFYDAFLAEKQLAYHQAIFHDVKKENNFPNTLIHLDQYFIFEKLELACRMLAVHRYLTPIDLKDSLVILEQLLPLLEAGFFEIPVIKVYYRAYRFLSNQDDDAERSFLLFEEELKTYHDHLSEEQLLSLNTVIRNHCITQYHKGTPGYLEKSFDVYQDHLEKGYLYHEGNLFAATILNIVVAGLRLKQFDWVFKFIEEHRGRIVGTNAPEEVYQLYLANYFFHIKNYNQALDYLIDTYEDVYYKLYAKRLEIKIYYEMKHVLLAPKIDAFKIYIYRFPNQKVTQKQKLGNRNFIDLLKQIQLPRTFKNEKRIQKLITKIHDSKYLTEKEWLLDQLEMQR